MPQPPVREKRGRTAKPEPVQKMRTRKAEQHQDVPAVPVKRARRGAAANESMAEPGQRRGKGYV